MNLSVGIVGLPNVGKSTLFNALLKKQVAFVANYPFATIEPNVGVVPVPDERLQKLAEIVVQEIRGPVAPSSHPMSSPPAGGLRALDGTITPVKQANSSFGLRSSSRATPHRSPPIVPAVVKFVDIAGLVKGANEGAGLGNKFLSHIREVSIIAHVVRVFEDQNVVKEGSVEPKTDYETIKTELILADLQTIQNAQSKIKKFQDEAEKSAIGKLFQGLNSGKKASEIELTDEEKTYIKSFFLLSAKPELIVLNVSENDYSQDKAEEITRKYAKLLGVNSEKLVVISAKIESDLAELSEEEQKEYLNEVGLKEGGLERLIRRAYETLGLISFLTAGEKEVRAWTIEKGTKAVNAAGVIHTDFMKNFIKAEIISYAGFVRYGGRKRAKELGKVRLEGRDYIVQDGDVIEFKIGQ